MPVCRQTSFIQIIKMRHSVLILLLFSTISCSSPSLDAAQYATLSTKFKEFKVKELSSPEQFRIWKTYSMTGVSFMYLVNQDKLIVKKQSSKSLSPIEEAFEINQENKILPQIRYLKEHIKIQKCNYCSRIGDGTPIILEYIKGGEYMVVERNILDSDYYLFNELTNIPEADSLEIRKIVELIYNLDNIKD